MTFLGSEADPFPDSLVFHVANETAEPVRVEACRLWLPAGNQSWRALLPQPWATNLSRFPTGGIVPARDCGGARVQTGRLPLTYTAIEVRLSDRSGKPLTLWAHLREPKDVFRIDADDIQDVTHRSTPQGVAIDDCISKVGIYVVTGDPSLRERLEARRRELIRFEESLGFDAARSDADFEALRSLGTKP